jgi:hypothetical protein
MRKRREINIYSIAFLDLLSGALGAVIILYVALPKQPTAAVEPSPMEQVLIAEQQQSQLQLTKLQAQLEQAQKELQAQKITPPIVNEPKIDADIGFKFKGKKVVFLIDTSYSMMDEERMGQVKGGLKMLLTGLSADYQVDIVQYPLGERAPFKSFWGRTREVTPTTRQEAFEFIYSLRPNGATPTREALLFILKNYEGISDIVLLSDGAPTLHNSNRPDNIADILQVLRAENSGRVRINTIGVGSDFVSNVQSDKYKFLSQLALEHDGFFMGF